MRRPESNRRRCPHQGCAGTGRCRCEVVRVLLLSVGNVRASVAPEIRRRRVQPKLSAYERMPLDAAKGAQTASGGRRAMHRMSAPGLLTAKPAIGHAVRNGPGSVAADENFDTVGLAVLLHDEDERVVPNPPNGGFADRRCR